MTTTAPVKRVRKYVYQVTIQSFISLQLKINLFFQFQEIFIYIYGSHLGEGTELLVLYIQWFYSGTLISSTNKTDSHDITEVLME
jgi:hypothetical protein